MKKLVDYEFINRIAFRLELFSWTRGTNLAVCRCPICGDSQKKKMRRRFYLIGYDDHYQTTCHNCGYNESFGSFLEHFDSSLYSEYRLEIFKLFGSKRIREKKPDVADNNAALAKLEALRGPREFVTCKPLNLIPEDHTVRRYVKGRQIPEAFLKNLWYTKNFRETAKEFSNLEEPEKIPEDARLVIPFLNEDGECKVLQGRSLDPTSEMRYITLKQTKETQKVFGLDRVNHDKQIFVVEGPIDSLFIPNCVATADSNLLSYEPGNILIPDKQPRNEALCKQIEKFIRSGKKVVLLPESLPGKDINEMINNGISQRDLLITIGRNVYQGIAAQMEFARWRKV